MKPIQGKGDEQFQVPREPMTWRDVYIVWAMAFGSLGVVGLVACVAVFWSELRGLIG